MIAALVYLTIYIVVLGIVAALLLYIIDAVPIPEPFHRVARIVVIVVCVLILILLLLQFAGLDGGVPHLR
jgi:hypothetical protein